MNRSIRHWKDHYQEGAPLVFMRRITAGGVTYEPGTPVPESLLKLIGPHRTKMWWNARVFRSAEQPTKTPPVVDTQPELSPQPEPVVGTPPARKKLGKKS